MLVICVGSMTERPSTRTDENNCITHWCYYPGGHSLMPLSAVGKLQREIL